MPERPRGQAGDKLLVSVSDNNGGIQYATMTYNGSTWTTVPALKKTTDSYTVTAYYAPAYEWGADGQTLTLV